MVGERPSRRRSGRGSARGGAGSADAGMSSEKSGGKPDRRKPEGSDARYVRVGLAGPKPRAWEP